MIDSRINSIITRSSYDLSDVGRVMTHAIGMRTPVNHLDKKMPYYVCEMQVFVTICFCLSFNCSACRSSL